MERATWWRLPAKWVRLFAVIETDEIVTRQAAVT
jgi:hypothetical protein